MRNTARAIAMLLVAGAGIAADKPQAHPHFNDGGTIQWHTKLDDAAAAAKKAGKLVFIEYGREA